MTRFEQGDLTQGDIVRVPFPYTDRNTRQRRPALVISAQPLGEAGDLVWVLMITSAENRGWPGDVTVSKHEQAGLPAPSIVRTRKIATIDVRYAERIGAIGKANLGKVLDEVTTILTP
jgi:mRNA interferase MazF